MPWVRRALEAPDCHLGLGKLCPRSGQREQARQYLTTATTLYREMDMPFLVGAGGRGNEGIELVLCPECR